MTKFYEAIYRACCALFVVVGTFYVVSFINYQLELEAFLLSLNH